MTDVIYYPGFGNVDVNASVDATAIQVSTLARLPLNEKFGVFGRLGYARITLDVSATASAQGMTETEDDSASENKGIYGIGADYQLNEKAALRAEYIKFGDTDISSLTIGVTYSF